MAAIDFPSSPSNGDTHTVGGVTYTYNSAETKWKTTISSNNYLPLTGGTVSGNIVLDGELQHSGDTDTNIAFDTDTILFDTAGSERFRVGSAGQLGIGGATYGTDGQVLTSTGATTAPAWEDIPSSGLTWLNPTQVSGQTSVIVTGIPTTAQYIKIAIAQVSQTSNGANQINLRFGNGSIETGNDYRWATSYGSNFQDAHPDSRLSLIHGAFTGNNAYFDGHFEMTRVVGADTWWTSSWLLADHGGNNYTNVGAGRYSATDTIDRVEIYGNGSTYNDGYIRVGYA